MEVKVYPRQTWNFRSHAVSACDWPVMSQPQWALKGYHMDISFIFHRSYLCGVSPLWAMMSQADACSYCMGSVVSISSQIYLYSSYFVPIRLIHSCQKRSLFGNMLSLFLYLVSDLHPELSYYPIILSEYRCHINMLNKETTTKTHF
jgi:hypothetical protein